jgi:hypothetical protein
VRTTCAATLAEHDGMGWRSGRGQAAVEVVAVAPAAVAVVLALGQGVAAAWTAAQATGAAAAAARAAAVGGDPSAAARRALPAGLRPGLRVELEGGRARVVVRVPAVVPGGLPGLRGMRAEAGT